MEPQENIPSARAFRVLPNRSAAPSYHIVTPWFNLDRSCKKLLNEKMPDPLPNSARPRAFNPDAVHRALLTGLLGSIGTKSGDAHEYAGPRNLKFNLFPGSALFKKKPQWVMASELVETTKLYARTVGPIRPEWVERAAAHLVKREYWDPHWSITRSRVEAWERVTLYGLVIVPRQTVDYGPIEPKLSRDLFLLHALVRGEFRSEAPFFKHNQKLIEQVLAL